MYHTYHYHLILFVWHVLIFPFHMTRRPGVAWVIPSVQWDPESMWHHQGSTSQEVLITPVAPLLATRLCIVSFVFHACFTIIGARRSRRAPCSSFCNLPVVCFAIFIIFLSGVIIIACFTISWSYFDCWKKIFYYIFIWVIYLRYVKLDILYQYTVINQIPYGRRFVSKNIK